MAHPARPGTTALHLKQVGAALLFKHVNSDNKQLVKKKIIGIKLSPDVFFS